MEAVEIATSIGYALKRVTWALRAAMEAELRALDVGVSQYATLELLHQRPGISNAELARGVFTSRQATHQLLVGLRTAGLVETRGEGREQRLALTQQGTRLLATASHAVAVVEQQMIAGLSPAEREQLRGALASCADALVG